MIDPQDAHVRAAARAALLDRLGRMVVDIHEAHRPRRHAHGRADDIVARAQPREAEPGAATALMDQGLVLEGFVNTAEIIVDGQDKARRQLPERAARVHQRRAVGLEVALGHQVIELVRAGAHRLRRGTVARIDRSDRVGDAAEHRLRGFDDVAVLVFDQVALSEHGQRDVGQRRRRRFLNRHKVTSSQQGH